MDFFEKQELAQRQTSWLIGLFGLALVGLVFAIYMVVVIALMQGDYNETTIWEPGVFAGVSVAVVIVVGAGSLYKAAQLAGGGESLAIALGGRRLQPDSSDPLEQKVLNVVEEMALASGLPVPPVFLMDNEDGINAFAAGLKPDNAVIGITRVGAEQLSRDELQGIVAHEFSHIFNGDMRLNMRLIALIHGILVLSMIGYRVIRATFSSGSSNSNSSKNSGSAYIFVLTLGISLIAIGYIGTLIGNIIKAAVSRQREFLADASAVQFTRNPDGIAGALKRIRNLNGSGSQLKAGRAVEASHMFFARGVKTLFATHPPLNERISRIDHFWQMEAPGDNPPDNTSSAAQPNGIAAFAKPPRKPPLPPPLANSSTSPLSAAEAIAGIGEPTAKQLKQARRFLNELPAALYEAAHEPYGARAIVYALLIDQDPKICRKQFNVLAIQADQAVHRETIRLHRRIAAIPQTLRLPLLNLSIRPLRGLSPAQYQQFRKNVEALVAADDHINLFEWSLQKIVFHSLDSTFRYRSTRAGSHRPKPNDAKIVLSAVAHTSSWDPRVIAKAYARGATAMGLEELTMTFWQRDNFSQLNKAIDALDQLRPKTKAKLIYGLAEAVAYDGLIEPAELELLRAISAAIHCPMPMFA
ncbi:MAG TPA: M48 family metallopeptidase [Prochlorococcus sp.]